MKKKENIDLNWNISCCSIIFDDWIIQKWLNTNFQDNFKKLFSNQVIYIILQHKNAVMVQ